MEITYIDFDMVTDRLWVEVQNISRQRWSGYICRSNCASAITFVPSCLISSWLLEQRNTSLRESLGAESTVWKMKVVRNNRARWGEKSEMSQTHTFTHPDSRFKMHPWGDFTRLKAVLSRLQGRTEGEAFFTDECVCEYECAARHATTRLCFIYLMQNILTVVLNGIKEWKVYRELWTRRHARKEKKEKKIILVQLETNMDKQELKTVQSLKKNFFVCVCH